MSLDHGISRVYKSCISRCLIEKMYFALSKRYILSLYTPSIWKIRTLLNYNLAKRIFMLKLCWLYTYCLIKNLRLSMCYRSRQKKNNVSREKKFCIQILFHLQPTTPESIFLSSSFHDIFRCVTLF